MNKSNHDLDFGYSPRNDSHHTNKMSWRRQDGSSPAQGYPSAKGYLAQHINDLVRNGIGARRTLNEIEYITVRLGGGAELWWCPKTRTLYALRPNGPLQGVEAPTFERHIKGAGLPCTKAQGATISESELNQWHGVRWVIDTGEAGQGAEDGDAPTQGALL